MAFQRPKKQPNFADLKAILSQTQPDNATYQLLESLIERLVQFQSLTINQIEEVIKSVDNGKGLQGPSGPAGPPGPVNPTVPLHAPTHAPGGGDTIPNVAWTNLFNNFTTGQAIDHPTKQLEVRGSVTAAIVFTNNSEPADSRKMRFHYYQRVARIDFLNDLENAVVGGTMSFSRDSGRLTVSGDILSQANFLHRDGTIGMQLATIISTFSDQFDFVNKANSSYLMRLVSPGDLNLNRNLTVGGSADVGTTVTAGGAIQGSQFKSNSTLNDVAIFTAPNYARVHWRNLSTVVGKQTYVLMNYSDRMRIVPTSDDGLNPLDGDWDHGLSVDHNGAVYTGVGGLSVRRIINSGGLAAGQFTPTITQYVQNVSSDATIAAAHYIRVGNTVHVDGKFDVTVTALGTSAWIRLTVPLIYAAVAIGHVTGADGSAGFVNQDSVDGWVDIIWIPRAAGRFSFYYSYSYQIT